MRIAKPVNENKTIWHYTFLCGFYLIFVKKRRTGFKGYFFITLGIKYCIMKTFLLICSLFSLNAICIASEKIACTDCSFTGTVVDGVTRKPMADVVITAKGNTAAGEQKVVTDQLGQYKMQWMPTGTYSLRFEKENYKSIEKKNISLKKSGIKLNIELSEEGETEEDYHNMLLKIDFI